MGNHEFNEMADNLDDLVKEGLGVFAKYRESMCSYKVEYLKYLLPNNTQTILDFGCGPGTTIPYFKKYFPNTKIYGCDVSDKSIEVAKGKYPDCEFSVINHVDNLQQYNGKIDCIFLSCVLHHIPPAEHEHWISGIYNSMRKGAFLIIFEMNMINPLSRSFVKKTPVDKNAIMLKPDYLKNIVKSVFVENEFVKLHYSYFFPWRNKIFTSIEHMLSGVWYGYEGLPLGAQYFIFAKK